MIERAFRVRKATDFSKVYKFGKSYNQPHFYIKAVKGGGLETRIAVIVPKKVSKKAVVRNRAKRRIYEIIREDWSQLQPSFIILITVKNDLSDVSAQQLHKDISLGLKTLGLTK